MAITDPVSGQAALLLLQTDITSRAVLESRMAALTESQLAMLEQMFPRHVLEYMVTKQPGQQPVQAETVSHLASSHENVTILFTDIVGFTSMSKEVKPDQVMGYLNELFTAFDALVDTYEIYKVETAGDCYIAAGGLTKIDQDGFICIDHEPDPVEAAHRVLSFAKALLYCAKTVMMPHNGQPTRIRVGMHTGPAVTGLIGTKLPKYSVFGDTMNTASRMESSCPYGCIQISEATHALLPGHPFRPTGGVEVKGKGRMDTFIWDPEEDSSYTMPPDMAAAIALAKRRASEAGGGGGFKELLPQLFNPQGSTSVLDDNSTWHSLSTTSAATPRMSRDLGRPSTQSQSWGEEVCRKSSMSSPQFPPYQHRGKRLSQSARTREGASQDLATRGLRKMSKSMPARPHPERPSELETLAALATLYGTRAPSPPAEQQQPLNAPWPSPKQHQQQRYMQQLPQQEHHCHQQQLLQSAQPAPSEEKLTEGAVCVTSVPPTLRSHPSHFLASPPNSSALYKVGPPSQADSNPLCLFVGGDEATEDGSRPSARASCTSRAGSHSARLPKAMPQGSSGRPSLSSYSSKAGSRSTLAGRSSSHTSAYASACASHSLDCLLHSAACNAAASPIAATESSRSAPLHFIHPNHSRRRDSESRLYPSQHRSSNKGKSSPLLLVRPPLTTFSHQSSGGAASQEALHHVRSSTFSPKSAPLSFLQPSSFALSQRCSGGASSAAGHATAAASMATHRRHTSHGSHNGAYVYGSEAQNARRHPLLGLLLQHTSPAQAELLLHEHTVAQQGRPSPSTPPASGLSATPHSPISNHSPRASTLAHLG
uniref:Guanylate cyclase domain-containing protein n=1 Tax=Dunaliella tertiolecta TaxID=3047 RepID=A0A7S3VP31_DUNTE